MRVFLLAVIFLGGVWACQEVEAETSASPHTADASSIDRDAVMDYLRPALKASDNAGRLSYIAPSCQKGATFPPFPKPKVRSPALGKTGLAAVQDMFGDDKNVTVTQGLRGIVRISIGQAADAILQTNMPLLTFNPDEQYDAFSAVIAIENAKEVKAAEAKFGLHRTPYWFSHLSTPPTKEDPHLPSTLTNVTMDQALDTVAETFGEIVIYGSCPQTGLYDIALANSESVRIPTSQMMSKIVSIPPLLEACIRKGASNAAKNYRTVKQGANYLIDVECNRFKAGTDGDARAPHYTPDPGILAQDLVFDLKPHIEIVILEDGGSLIDGQAVAGNALESRIAERMRADPPTLIRIQSRGKINSGAISDVVQVLYKLKFDMLEISDSYNPKTGAQSEAWEFTTQ